LGQSVFNLEVSFLPPRSYGNCKDKGGDKEDDFYSRIPTAYLIDSDSYHVQRDKIEITKNLAQYKQAGTTKKDRSQEAIEEGKS
jgi:hypothetical protein